VSCRSPGTRTPDHLAENLAAADVDHDATADVDHDATADVDHDATADVDHDATADIEHDATADIDRDAATLARIDEIARPGAAAGEALL